MDLNRKTFTIFISALILFLPLTIFLAKPNNDKLQLIACNVGQGDAILVSKGSTQILIDGGPDQKVLDCLGANLPFYDRQIEMVINTHPDADHLTGLIDVINNYQVEQLIINSIPLNTDTFKYFFQTVHDKQVPVYSPQQGDVVEIGELKLKFLWPEQKIGNLAMWQDKDYFTNNTAVLGVQSIKTNENSIVIHLQYHDFDALLTGDITSDQEQQIISNYQFSDIEVLKVAHHGSKYSSSQKFLENIKPQYAMISVGKNPWGHPTQEVLDRLKQVNAQILRTDEDEVKLEY